MTTRSYNDIHSSMTQSTIEQKASELLVGSFVKETFQVNDGTLYILIVIKKNAIK